MDQSFLDVSGLFFIKTISDHLHNKKTEYDDSIDWNKVLEYAIAHKLEGIVFLQCRRIIPKDKQALFGSKALLQFQDTKDKQLALEKITSAFSRASIDFALVKGFELAECYPDIKERSMNDIDIVVKPEDKSRAGKILLDLGFSEVSLGFYEWEYIKDGVTVELHDHLMYKEGTGDREYSFCESMWDHAFREEGSSRFHLDWNFHLVYLILHLRTHFVNGGVGFRQFLDMAFLCQKKEIDVLSLRKDLESLGLFKFASICFSFCERWFDVKMPFSADLGEDFYLSSTKMILCNGVFGSSKDKITNYVYAKISDDGRFKAFFKRYFPSRKDFGSDPRFNYLKKYPVLLPYAWIQRYIYAIRSGKLSDESAIMSSYFVSKSEIKKRNKELACWGIDKDE